jgi:hypothetical protein
MTLVLRGNNGRSPHATIFALALEEGRNYLIGWTSKVDESFSVVEHLTCGHYPTAAARYRNPPVQALLPLSLNSRRFS